MLFCNKCGKKNIDQSRFCKGCGAPLAPSGEIVTPPRDNAPKGDGQITGIHPVAIAIIQMVLVFVVCAIFPLLLGSILGWPARTINDALPSVTCNSGDIGTYKMYLCSAKVGLLAMGGPLILMVIVFVLRKFIMKGVGRLMPRLPEVTRFLVMPVIATLIFTLAWAGFHKETWSQTGILPQNIFPAVIGLFTFSVARFGPTVQRIIDPFFAHRDKLPRALCYIGILVLPMLISLAITYQDRVSQEALKEQFVVMVALVVAYLLITPRLKTALSGGSGTGGPSKGSPAFRSLLLVLGGIGFTGMLLEHFLTDTVAAHCCSSEGDCQQTAGYNATTATGGGIIGAASGVLGSQVAATGASMAGGAAGTAVITPTTPPIPGATPGAVIIDEDGEPLPTWSPEYGAGDDGNAGQPGDVWYDGNWVDPEYAQEQVAEDIQAAHDRDVEREAFWEDAQQRSEQWLSDRADQLESEAAQERAENQSRQDALQQLDRIEDYAISHGYSDILDRAENDALNPDGTINVEYTDRLADVLSNHIRRDTAAPDSVLQQGWVEDFATNTFNDARHNPLIRVGAGVLSGGTSEIYFQSQAAWEAMEQSYNQAADRGEEWDISDAVRTGYGTLVRENLPLNTYYTLQNPDATWTDIALSGVMDVFQTFDTLETANNVSGSLNLIRGGGGAGAWDVLTHRADPISLWSGESPDAPGGKVDLDGTGRADMDGRFDADGGGGRVDGEGVPLADGRLDADGRVDADASPARDVNDLPPGSQVKPDEFGIPPDNARGIQQVADEFDVDIEMRSTNPHSVEKLANGDPPKLEPLKTKTIGALDCELGAKPSQLGEVGYFEPKLPDGVTRFDDMSPELQSRYCQRFEEYALQGPKIHDLETKGLIKVQDGVVINTGLNPDPNTFGRPFVGDHDIFRIVPRGSGELTSELQNQIVESLRSNGGGGHGGHMHWNPTSDLHMEMKYNIANGHFPTADGGGGEALIKFSSGESPVSSFATVDDMGSMSRPPDMRSLEFMGPDGEWTK